MATKQTHSKTEQLQQNPLRNTTHECFFVNKMFVKVERVFFCHLCFRSTNHCFCLSLVNSYLFTQNRLFSSIKSLSFLFHGFTHQNQVILTTPPMNFNRACATINGEENVQPRLTLSV